MSFIAGILTLILLLNSLLLILLVLVQLPKKDAGAGLAFGGGTADALFGAGSGNALTKITKWGTVAFIVIALVLGYLQDSVHRGENNSSDFLKSVGQKQMQTAVPAQPASQTLTPAPNSLPASTPLLSTNASAPAVTTTNK
jgi:preprotein translocase subunit SecG